MTQTIPIPTTTVDTTTGQVIETTTIHAAIMPAPPGTCPDCARSHAPDQPHDAASLHYQYVFYGKEGRWPNWSDAMAHCSPELRAQWTAALTDAGVNVAAGEIRPSAQDRP